MHWIYQLGFVLTLVLATADAAVLGGRLASLPVSFYDSDTPVVVQLRIPMHVINQGVCVDLDPIKSAFKAGIMTICTSSSTSVAFDSVKPGVYYVRVRMRTSGIGIDLWDERAVVVNVLSGNLSMARTMNFVMLFGGVLLALFVFIVVPLRVMRLPFQC
jgi:hypothetical protein